MRHVRSTAAVLAILAVAAGSQATGCLFSADTEELKGTPSGTGGTGGVEPPSCPGDPVADPSLVRDECGTFVSSSAGPGGDGTKAKPYQTFGEAAANGAKRIYACSGAYTEVDGVRFNGGVEIFGGFTDCAGGGAWTWAEASRATLNGVANKVALTLDGGDNLLRNVNVTAANATDPGASSIAVVASGGTLDVSSGDLTAGDAMDGDPGESREADPTLDGDDGDPGVGVCAAGLSNPGPVGKTKTCPAEGNSVAGSGGDGGGLMGMMLLPAGGGTNGAPADPGQPTKGVGGAGQDQANSVAVCEDGLAGANGATGESGTGATGPGSLTIDGYAGVNGASGMNGKPGQGGGGGGASQGGTMISCPGGGTSDRVGASGGSGGTGGCGGAPGGGGQAGGSSIALIVIDATVNLSQVTLTGSRAGNAGAGGDGQMGGLEGSGGALGAGAGSAEPSCRGAVGGLGGNGGPGGGGQGGHSLGIAFQGTTAPVQDSVTIATGAAGTGGLGGANSTAPMNGLGVDGTAANCWDFAANAECPAG